MTPSLDYGDLSVKVPGGLISVIRSMREGSWLLPHDRYDLSFGYDTAGLIESVTAGERSGDTLLN